MINFYEISEFVYKFKYCHRFDANDCPVLLSDWYQSDTLPVFCTGKAVFAMKWAIFAMKWGFSAMKWAIFCDEMGHFCTLHPSSDGQLVIWQ